MAYGPLGLLVAIALVLVLPGYLTVRALWPRGHPSRPDPAARAVLSVVLSFAIAVVVGSVLGFLPHADGAGWLQTAGTGLPIVEIALAAVSLGLFFAGNLRARRLAPAPSEERPDPAARTVPPRPR